MVTSIVVLLIIPSTLRSDPSATKDSFIKLKLITNTVINYETKLTEVIVQKKPLT